MVLETTGTVIISVPKGERDRGSSEDKKRGPPSQELGPLVKGGSQCKTNLKRGKGDSSPSLQCVAGAFLWFNQTESQRVRESVDVVHACQPPRTQKKVKKGGK